MDSLDKEYTQEQILLRSRHQLQSAIPLLQRQFLQSLLADDEACARLTQAKLDELQLPLLLEHPLLLVVCRVDEWPNPLSLSDKELLRYAVNNIADESLVLARLAQTSIGDNRFVWFLQPAALQDKSPAAARNPEEPGLSDADRELWQKMIRFVHGTLETVQQTCRNLLRLPLSIIAGQAPVAWTQLGKQYQSLSRILDIGPGNGREMLLIEPAGAPAAHRSAPPAYHLQWLSALESYLEHGQKQPFLDEFQRTSEAILSSGTERRYFLEFYYKVVSMLLAYLNRMDMPDVLEKLDLDRLLHFSRYSSDEEALRHLRDAIESVVEGRQFAQDARTHQVVRELQEFIAEHLSEDLSLTVLAEKVHHHPFYLSRLYKQCTGVSLSDYIASLRIEKAKSLLKETHMKIYEVGKAVGFESAGYFIRFFKKHTGMTPNEYKEGVLRKK
jgi:two-component system response regulator YesN